MVMLVYFYEPPSDQGLNQLIPVRTYLGFVTLLGLVMLGGRLFDGITDPLIAQFTDRSKNPKGRRIPLMRWAVIPTVLFSGLMYLPWFEGGPIMGNVAWLAFTQFGFFLFMTLYNVPYNALLPELGHSSREKLQLATYQGVFLLLGMILAAAFLVIAQWLAEQTFQYAIWFYTVLAGICMAIPAWSIDEKKYCVARPASTPILQAMRLALTNRHFKFFLVADFSYWTAMTIVYSSLLYYVTVLMGQPDAFGTTLMGIMVLGALPSMALLPMLTRRFGKKRLIIFSFATLGALLFGIIFVGHYPIDERFQGYLISIITCLPLAIMSTLPTTLLAEIADLDGRQTGEQKEGMFFAVRNFSQKMGQTLGMFLIAILIQFGKDPGDDLGVRLTGVAGVFLCAVAGITFAFFREKRMQQEIREVEDPLVLHKPGA
jgi:GPH family glycoside/pentoside/hexuronide:cation symporter